VQLVEELWTCKDMWKLLCLAEKTLAAKVLNDHMHRFVMFGPRLITSIRKSFHETYYAYSNTELIRN